MKNKPGKGKKICKNCQEICAPATKICVKCNTPFSSKYKLKKEISESRKNQVVVVPNEYMGYRIVSTIYVPAGKPPIDLKDNPSINDVVEWADKIRIHFLETQNIWMLNHAIRYYLRYKYDGFDDKEAEVLERLSNVVDNLPDIQIIENEVV
jgi:hypothetical protein